MLLDANLLLYAVQREAEQHERATEWLTEQLNGSRRIGLPWQSLAAFLRIATHPRAFERPLSSVTAWERVRDWLEAPVAWIPEPGPEYPRLLGELITTYDARGNLVPDVMLAALAVEHGVALCSADTDFARFRELRWRTRSADERCRCPTTGCPLNRSALAARQPRRGTRTSPPARRPRCVRQLRWARVQRGAAGRPGLRRREG